MKEIQKAILDEYPNASIVIESFGSGAESMDVRIEDRLFVCAFIPSQGYGIDEIKDDCPLTSTYSNFAPNAEGAVEVLFRLIRGL